MHWLQWDRVHVIHFRLLLHSDSHHDSQQSVSVVRPKVGTKRNEESSSNSEKQERHQYHSRISTNGRHRRRSRSHGLRMVNRTTQQSTSTEPSAQGAHQLRLCRIRCGGFNLQSDNLRQKFWLGSCHASNVLCEG